MQEIELFRFLLDGKKIGSIWINLQEGFTKFVGSREEMQKFTRELGGKPIIGLGVKTNKRELKSKCCGAKLLEPNSNRYYSPYSRAVMQPKCSKCRKYCNIEKEEEAL